MRVFLDEGPPMAALLRAADQQGVARDHVRRLVAGAGAPGPSVGGPSSPLHRGLVEPLSRRELEVLRLLRTDLSGPDIARELIVAVNTMRSHTKSSYTKLGVNSHREAVRRAEQLDL